jgi:hypothetical protein
MSEIIELRCETPEQRRDRHARGLVDHAISAYVAIHEPGSFEIRPVVVGSAIETLEPQVLPGLEAAHRILVAARAAEQYAVRYARANGYGWDAIGKAMLHDGSDGMEPGVAAEVYVAQQNYL